MDALRGEISALNADLERLRAEYRAMETRPAIMRGSAELVGKEPGADPDNLTSREKTILIRKAGEAPGVNAESLPGEIGGAPADLVNRDFHAANPNEPWVTDITEFRIPAGKVYLSPVIDCYDGMPVAWTIGTSPNAAVANGMLESACATLKTGETPIIHSDRGCHYRWDEWIRICKEHGLTRSMSAKGCRPDNAAAEGFFGRLKQEFFHKRSFQGVSIDEFITLLDEYMVWYRDKRIKLEYGMSIMDKRIQLGLVA